jgi:hypothetical protein
VQREMRWNRRNANRHAGRGSPWPSVAGAFGRPTCALPSTLMHRFCPSAKEPSPSSGTITPGNLRRGAYALGADTAHAAAGVAAG